MAILTIEEIYIIAKQRLGADVAVQYDGNRAGPWAVTLLASGGRAVVGRGSSPTEALNNSCSCLMHEHAEFCNIYRKVKL